MSIEFDIQTVLKPLASGGVFFDSAPFDTPKPYIVISQIGGQPVGYLESVSPDKKNGRFQINAWHNTRSTASALGRLIEKTLVESPLIRAEVMNGLAYRFDEETGLKGTEQDFSIWYIG